MRKPAKVVFEDGEEWTVQVPVSMDERGKVIFPSMHTVARSRVSTSLKRPEAFLKYTPGYKLHNFQLSGVVGDIPVYREV